MKTICAATVVALSLALACAQSTDAARDCDFESLRINQIQMLATHNSYHVKPPEERYQQMVAMNKEAEAWDYTHAPLDVQLDRGIRSFELDGYCSSEGFRVLHVPNLDNVSTCDRMVDCLRTISEWSLAHPGHLPIITILELKDVRMPARDFKILEIDAWALEMLDNEIRSVFSPEQLITPDDIRGDHPTLEAAVLAGAWPTVAEARDKHIIVLMNGGKERRIYTEGRPSIEGRPMFTRSEPGQPDAAFLLRNSPNLEHIQGLVRQGYYVRTRADSNLREGREGITAHREEALASGAQIVTTDFPPGEAHPETGYVVEFNPPAAARANPANAPENCADLQTAR